MTALAGLAGMLVGMICYSTDRAAGGSAAPYPVRLVVTPSGSQKSIGSLRWNWVAAENCWSYAVSGLPLGVPLLAHVDNLKTGTLPSGWGVYVTRFRPLGNPAGMPDIVSFALTKTASKKSVTFVPYQIEVPPLPPSPSPAPSVSAT